MTSKSLTEATGFDVAPRNDMLRFCGSLFNICLVPLPHIYQYHISIVLLPPPPLSHVYRFTATITTFLLFHYRCRHHRISILLLSPSPPHFYCFATATTLQHFYWSLSITYTPKFLLFHYPHHHYTSIIKNLILK